MKTAAVIGAGFGGLALAIRLQSAGVKTTVIEARDRPGGRAYVWERDGFTFDAGPTVITDPACLKELWALSGRRMEEDIALLPVSPFYRLNWPDGVNFDYSNDEASLTREIAKLRPEDVAGYAKFLDYSAGVYREGYEKLGHVAFLDFASMIKAAPALARYQAWRSVYSIVSSYVQDEHLRQALSFHTLLVGGNPMTTSAIYALIHKLEKDGGVWFAQGGTNKLVSAMVTQFERLGGTLRLDDAVAEIETLGDRATGVRTKSGWHGEFDAVASNGDIVHTYRDLLSGSARGKKAAAALERKKFSPSLFVVHFGIKGAWPGIPHHMILFGPRYKGLLTDIYDHGVLPEDFSLYLHHPTITDPSMAPEGCSTFYALAPVPHMGKLPIDWAEVGPAYADRILAEVEKRLIPDLRGRLMTSFHYTPADFGHDLNAHLGSAFSLEPVLTQSAWFRVHNRDDAIPNLYFVGAGTHPGAGIPGVVGSAKATAALMLGGYAGMKRLAVYCGSATPADPAYIENARAVGAAFAARGIGLVYGGGRLGLMGAIADAVLAGGGEAIGVIPQALVNAEVAHRGLSELHVVDTMHLRKAMFTDLADGFVTLPGGTGTMDELWEAMSWAQLGYHGKPVGLLNVNGYYDGLIAFVETMAETGFLRPQHRDILIVENDLDPLLARMAAHVPPTAIIHMRREEL